MLEAGILDDIKEKAGKQWSVRAGVLQMMSLGGFTGKFQGDNKYFKADGASSGEKGVEYPR